MATNKSAKGGEFERETCRDLSVWVTGDPNTDVLFWRTSQSGGRVTQRANNGKAVTRAHCGDIYALDSRGAFLTNFITWELKNGYYESSVHELLDRPNGWGAPYADWIKQADKARVNAGTPYWAIVHHRRARKDVMLMPGGLWRFLGCSESVIGGSVFHMTVAFDDRRIELVACHFKEFLKGVTPKEIKRFASHASQQGKIVREGSSALSSV